MDLGTLTNDDLADHIKSVFDELHARADALPAGTYKWMAKDRLDKAHAQFNRLKRMTSDEGLIQPLSGGGPKP